MANGIAKLLTSVGGAAGAAAARPHAGMGIVLDARHVLTCAHVVNSALSLPFETTAKPSARVPVAFPMVAGSAIVDGIVSLWLPMSPDGSGDVAILELGSDVPAGVGSVRFSGTDALRKNEELQIFGVKEGELQGNHVVVKFVGEVEAGVAQIDGQSFERPFIQPGYSGAAVRDANDDVVGMAVAEYAAVVRVAYMIPVWVLRTILPSGLTPNAPKSASTVTIKGEKGGAKADAITLFCHHCGGLVGTAFPRSPFKFSTHAKAIAGIADQRFFYIADPSEKLNLLVTRAPDDYPLSYEFYFQRSKLIDSLQFEVALVLDVDYDMEIFGTYKWEERMQAYQNELSTRLGRNSTYDFVRVGAENRLEIGFRRRLTRLPEILGLEDAADHQGHGAESAAKDIISLKRACEPILTDVVMSYRRP